MNRLIVLVAAAAALGACQQTRSSAPAAPTTTVRASVETAPADLQLLCANEASTRFGSTSVLPVSSARASANTFNVDLTFDGNRAACVVDDNGNIVSLARA